VRQLKRLAVLLPLILSPGFAAKKPKPSEATDAAEYHRGMHHGVEHLFALPRIAIRDNLPGAWLGGDNHKQLYGDRLCFHPDWIF